MLKVGSADLVLRMIEAGMVMRDLTLENPIRAIREMSHDMTGRKTVRLANGRELSALQIQREYLERAQAFADREGLEDPIHKQVLDLWERTLTRRRHRQPVPGRHRDRLGDQAQAHHRLHGQARPADGRTRGSPSSTSPTTTSTADAGCSTCCRSTAGPPGSCTDPEMFEAKTVPAADHPGQAARRLHQGRPGAPPRLHRRLGAPQAQRPGPAHRPVQGPVRGRGRPGDRLIEGM